MRFIIFTIILVSAAIAIIPHIAYIVAKLIDWLLHLHKVSYRPFGLTALGMTAVWVILFLWGNLYGRFTHETKKVTIECNGLPQAFDGYRIVQISDLHLDGWVDHEDGMKNIVSEINAMQPDAIVFTGDIVSLGTAELRRFVPVLRQLKAKDGVFSIMGNHDYLPYDRSLSERQRSTDIAELQRIEREELGWNLLLNEHSKIFRDGDSIAIVGSENQSMGVHRVIQRGDLRKALAGTEGMTSIVLTHDPTHWRGEITDPQLAVAGYNLPLTLSGHTHAAQFRILGFSLARFVYDEYDGLYTEGNQHLYVNIGLGGTMPMRVGATPEVTLLTLNHK